MASAAHRRLRVASRLVLLGVLAGAPMAQEPVDEEYYERRVRPLLAERCVRCHGEAKQKSRLRVDSIDALLAGGERGPALAPHDAEGSRLVQVVRYGDELQMPPRGKLAPDEIETIERWVAAGAPGPRGVGELAAKPQFDLQQRRREHWAFAPIQDPPVPASSTGWVRDPVDAFVERALQRAELAPAAPADRATLLRRAWFDVVGLPPPVEALERFLADQSAHAWRAAVDELLAMPQFGERWARHWLDLMRYGESRGHEFDYILPNAYQYRDYVVRALNDDVGYDQFLVEHVAGDLLDEPRLNPETGANESVLATGFWYLGEEVHSPVDPRADEADRIDNKIDVFSKAFLGLTVACARCHDHKFDAISTRDYYALSGYLLSSSYRQVRFESMPHNGSVAAELEALEREHRGDVMAAVAAAMRNPTRDAADYLLAAGAVSVPGPGAGGSVSADRGVPVGNAPPLAFDVVFEDFEQPLRERGWHVEGTAFGEGATPIQELAPHVRGVKARGEGVAHGHGAVPVGSSAERDRHVGRLLSPAFRIDRDYVHLLVGGGEHPGLACVNVLVDGAPVATVTGHNATRMRPARLDLRTWRGREARIEIVDRAIFGWGHISVDQIVFADESRATALDATLALADGVAWSAAASEVAAQRGLDPRRLAAWVGALWQAERDPAHPLRAWVADAVGPRPASAQPSRSARAGTRTVVDYGALPRGHWLQDGYTFGPGPKRAGDPRWSTDPAAPLRGIVAVAAAEQDPAWQGLRLAPNADRPPGEWHWVQSGRMLRTPTFVIDGDKLAYRVRGAGHAAVIVDGHRMFAGPLHVELLRDWPDAAGYRWVEHDVAAYRGHRAYVEFSPSSDESSHALFIAEVVCGDGAPAERVEDNLWSPALLAGNPSRAELARRYAERWREAVEALGRDRLADAGEAVVGMAAWMCGAEGLFAPDAPSRQALVARSREFCARRAALIDSIQRESHTAIAVLDGTGIDEHVLIRGDAGSPGELVPRRSLEAFGGAAAVPRETGSGRLELARSLVEPKNPLVARVAVNRVWHHLFGRGLVPSVDNFGVLGVECSHPELLDHLAQRFVRDGWSIRRLLRRLLLSSTYRMASTANADAERVDPTNRLLHRANVRRLSAEAIRDAMLAVSGSLSDEMGGKSVPLHLTPFMDGRGRPESGPLDGEGRRSLYLAVRRNFLSPMFLAFDFPIPFTARGRRDVTNVPAQALTLMNSPLVTELAARWAARAEAAPVDEAARIRMLYRQALSRAPTQRESAAARRFLAQQRAARAAADPDGDAPSSPWPDLCHVLFNLKDFIYVR